MQLLPDIAAAGIVTAEEAEMALLQAMDDFAQEEFRGAGITEAVVHRSFPVPSVGMDPGRVNEMLPVHDTALASCAPEYRTAEFFSGSGGKADRTGVVIEMKVPVERIIGTARTGFGCLNEWGFVMLGGELDNEACIPYLQKDRS